MTEIFPGVEMEGWIPLGSVVRLKDGKLMAKVIGFHDPVEGKGKQVRLDRPLKGGTRWHIGSFEIVPEAKQAQYTWAPMEE
jgi:starvation-inducible outer membrane lipoprotein